MSEFLFIKANTWELLKRMAFRSFFLLVLSALGFWGLEHMVQSGMQDRLHLVHRFPEFMALLKATACFTFSTLR